jgi:glycosyltransferase involved in cell wall biosynthesis
MLAKALARRGLQVAIIAYGTSAELPTEVEGVSIIARRPYKKVRRLIQRVPEAFRIWRSLFRAPSRTIVYRAAGSELGVVAVFARLARRRLVFSSANVVDFHLGELMSNRRGLVRRADLFMYKLGIRLAGTIVVQTEEQIPLCEAAFGRRPVLIKSIQPLAEPQAQPAEAFLWVGRLVSYKRPLEYIALARALPEAKFWMVGVVEPARQDNALLEAVSTQSQELPNLELLPPRPQGELWRLMARAVASVNTADREGMPNALLEAWTRGIPALVLTHDPGGVVEGYGLGGFANGSLDKLVELAREHWAGRNDRASLSQRCRRYIQTHHAPDVIAERWTRVVCGSVLDERQPSMTESEPAGTRQ